MGNQRTSGPDRRHRWLGDSLAQVMGRFVGVAMREESFSDDDDDVDDVEERFVDEPCSSCGTTEDVSIDPNGEPLCPDCGEGAWL